MLWGPLDPLSLPPSPLECHPWYADKPWVFEWVSGRSQLSNTYHLRVPVVPVPRLELVEAIDNFYPESLTFRQIIVDRHKAIGLAPYVGEPFVYMWWVGIDNLGRCVCSDSVIVHTNPMYEFSEQANGRLPLLEE